MQDGIIAGNGNSRYLKTVAEALSLYPTYQDFIAALIAGTFPIDLNGINAAGWVQQGTALNKANLLADATASSIGLGTSATPNDAFSRLQTQINTVSGIKTEAVFGTYTGNRASRRTIGLGFRPKAVLVFMWGMRTDGSDGARGGLALDGHPVIAYGNETSLEIVATGFDVFYSSYLSKTNDEYPYNYIAFK